MFLFANARYNKMSGGTYWNIQCLRKNATVRLDQTNEYSRQQNLKEKKKSLNQNNNARVGEEWAFALLVQT